MKSAEKTSFVSVCLLQIIHSAKIWDQPRCLSTEGRIKNVVFTLRITKYHVFFPNLKCKLQLIQNTETVLEWNRHLVYDFLQPLFLLLWNWELPTFYLLKIMICGDLSLRFRVDKNHVLAITDKEKEGSSG